jgi:hypothetical protein
MFAYVSAANVEITVAGNHVVSLNNLPLPVVISSFNSAVKRNDVSLAWVTESEINNRRFEIERKTGDASWQKVGFINGSGTTSGQKSYSYEDKKLETKTYKYRLKQVDYNGSFEYFNLQNEVAVGKPGEFKVSQNYPNPSNPKSKIDYEIPVTGKVAVRVYDVLGKEVSTLVNELKDAGYYSAEFDGTNLASGIYFYRIIAEGEGQNFTKTMKMILVK